MNPWRQLPVFVTGNQNKLEEVRHILGSFNILVESQSLDIPEVQGNTQEVASSKCKRAAELVGGPCITEDTALCFHALNGLPGPYIKDFMAKMGHEGLNRLLDGFSTRGATAVCTFAYCPGPGMEPVLFEGKTEGTIVPARGSTHFGWDAVFQPSGSNLTYAEMDPSHKNSLSHRYKALNMLVGYLKHGTI